MTYIITFYDKCTITISDEQGIKIQEAIIDQIKHIRVGEDLFATSAISKVEKIREPQKMLIPSPEGYDWYDWCEPPVYKVKKETIKKLTADLVKKFNWTSKKTL